MSTAAAMGLTLMPHQVIAAQYITALGPDNKRAFKELCIVMARQNGKTTLMLPFILHELRAGKKIMHLANNRNLPRTMFDLIARELSKTDSDLFPKRRGRVVWPRYAAGTEEIFLTNGAAYRIAAATRGGARGFSCDIVIVDELREMEDFEAIAAAEPTLSMSNDPQMVYLSNAGTDASVVLNGLRDRAADDPALAYLEWSSAPDRSADDRAGWLEANPAVGQGHGNLWDYLERKHESYRLTGQMGLFETEHLCRWVHTILPSIIKVETWEELAGDVEPPRRPALGVSLDPNGQRASAVLSWQQDDGRVAVRLIADVIGNPIDVPAFGADLKRLAQDYRVKRVAYDGATDAELAKYFAKPEAISGAKFTNASSMFVNLAESHQLVWDGEPITPDIEWTGRKTHEAPGTWTAVKLSDEHPVTAMLATIRAVWLASGPKPVRPRLH
jgi:hypothetical protein